MTVSYELTAPQSEIAECKTRFRVVNAGRRFGKTWLAGAEILKALTKKKGAIVWYVAPVADQARTLMWKGWIKKYLPPEWIYSKNEQRMELVLKNGSELRVLSADEPDHLRGSGVDFLVMDECALMKPDAYEVIRPCLSDKNVEGRALFISTPRGFNWFYDIYAKGVNEEKDWKSFQFTTIQGGNVPEEEIETAKRDLSENRFNEEYLASFETLSNRVYESFDRIGNTVEMEDWFGKGDVHIGIDFNVNPMTAAIAVTQNDRFLGKRITFFDEIVDPNSNTQALANMIKRKFPHSTIFVYPDPTGNKRQTTSAVGLTDMKILRDNGFIVCSPHAPYPTRDKFNTVNTGFCNAAGDRRVFVAKDRCMHLRKAFEGYAYKENGEPDKSSGLDHISDAAAYLICYNLPFIMKGRVQKPRVLGV